MIAKQQKQKTNKPSRLWWLLAVILLLLFLFVQLPAAWLVKRFAPNTSYLENISGNLWQGQAQWRITSATQKIPLAGSVQWQWRPWELILLRLGADITLTTGQTELEGRVALGKNKWQARGLSGSVAANTIASVSQINWPNTSVEVKSLSLGYKKGTGWTLADGSLVWAGGSVGYPVNSKVQRVDLPAMTANLMMENSKKTQESQAGKLHLALLNANDERMGDLYLDADNMMDVQLTQRLLVNVQGYKGNAAMDTAVVSLRQPLSSMMH